MLKNLLNYLFWLFMIISIYGLVKYSNFDVINLPLNMESIFIKPTYSDGIFLNLSIGYIVSSVFYLMIVYYPDKIRKEKFTKVALDELSTVCTDATLQIVNIYKNVSFKSEWNYKHIDDDSMFFDENFYSRMRRFDVFKTADTLLCHKEEPCNTITWDDKLNNDFEDYIKRIDEILSKYLQFLDDKIIDSILKFKKNTFFTTYLGLPSNEVSSSYTGKDGKKYLDRVPLHVFLNDKSEKKKIPIFEKAGDHDNRYILKSYVETLVELRKYCYKTSGFQKNIAFRYFCEDLYGQCEIAIYDDFYK